MIPPALSITRNGSPIELPAALTIAPHHAPLDLARRPGVVEVNESAILPRQYPTTLLADGDRVEIVTLAAGG